MKILIIEDEAAAARRLQKMLESSPFELTIPGQTDSVETTVEWLQTHPQPDLIFSDIHLADGLCFEIFEQVTPDCPIIFTTAYDQYAIQAFKLNSIDYLLKPVKQAELTQSLQKFHKLHKKHTYPAVDYASLLKMVQQPNAPAYQKRFVIRFGQTIKAIDVADAAYFYTESKINFITTFEGKRYPVDYNLEQLANLLDPAVYFRINRQFIININAIQEMYAYSKSRVKLMLNPETAQETIVSKERSPLFKEWLKGG